MGSRVFCLGSRVQALEVKARTQGSGFRGQGLGLTVPKILCRNVYRNARKVGKVSMAGSDQLS